MKYILGLIFSVYLLQKKNVLPQPMILWILGYICSLPSYWISHIHQHQLADYLNVGKVLDFNLITSFLEKK